MKHCKYILPVLAVAAAFTACNNTEDLIFEGSASERLDAAKDEYTKMLADKGGKWKLEYFSNGDEPGYIMGMHFGSDGSVNVCANHKWIGSTYQEERSSWTILTDDGPVLSYDTYNNLFHIFADPANITGPNAPTDPDRNNEDINESGYGHSGDYEFVLMETSADGDSIRLKGKKRGITHWLVRLPENTDMESYLTETTQKASRIFSEDFNKLILIDNARGEKFVVRNSHTGIMSVFPMEGDSVTQTVKKNFLMTELGIRFMDEFNIPRASDDDEDKLKVTSFKLNEDGTLSSDNDCLLTGADLMDVLTNVSSTKGWSIVPESVKGRFAQEYQNIVDGCLEYNNSSFTTVRFCSQLMGREVMPTIHFDVSGVRIFYYYNFKYTDGNQFGMEGYTSNTTANNWRNRVPAIDTFYKDLESTEFVLSTATPLQPNLITFTDVEDSESSFIVEFYKK